MLQVTGLKKSYKRFPVLTGLNMSISKGDIYGLLGTNGCGKTTTMNIICNIIPKDEGQIEFDGDSLKIGYLPETPELYGYMSGYEYLNYIGACCRFDGDIANRTAEVLEITGMTNGANRLIKGYSRGMNQRIGIAAALYANPDLLILDEPTSALDPSGRAEVMDIIQRLAMTGSTIILCTHILPDVERVANKIGILRNGVMVIEGNLKDVKDRFETGSVLNIVLRRYTVEAVEALRRIDAIAGSEYYEQSGVTLFAKNGINDKELYIKAISTLASLDIVPESISFRRMTLEQIYIGITNGSLNPNPYSYQSNQQRMA